MCPCVIDERACQNLPMHSRKAKRAEEFCLAGSFRMVKGKKVISYLTLLNDGVACIREDHSRGCLPFLPMKASGILAERPGSPTAARL